MVFTKHKMFAPAVLITCLLVFSASPVLAQDTTNPAGSRTVASGQKMKLKGVVTRRDADTFVVRDMNGVDTTVRLSDRTSVKTKGGFLRSGTNYAQTSILRGLNLEVEGRGNASGELEAEKVRFDQ
jgi:endonuclease YncB( thermonuclease family)